MFADVIDDLVTRCFIQHSANYTCPSKSPVYSPGAGVPIGGGNIFTIVGVLVGELRMAGDGMDSVKSSAESNGGSGTFK